MSQPINLEIVKLLKGNKEALASYMASLVPVQPTTTANAKAEKVVMTEEQAIQFVTTYVESLSADRKKAVTTFLTYLNKAKAEGRTTVMAGKGKENKKPIDCTVNTIETILTIAHNGANLYGGYYMKENKKEATDLSKMGRLNQALAFPSAVLKLNKSLGVK
jgi:hypothetical protein